MKWWQKIRNWFKKTFLNQTIESPDMAEESFLEWLGIKKKNRNGALSEVTYFTCLKMMSETVAKLPWKYYQKTANGIAEPELNDVAKLLKYRPNPFMTPTAFWNAVEMNRNHFGNAYVYVRSKFSRKRYGGEYKVLDLWVMPSNCVQIVVDDAGYFGGAGRSGTCTAISTAGSSTFSEPTKSFTSRLRIPLTASQDFRCRRSCGRPSKAQRHHRTS